jgi:hypothetical protein
MIHYRIRGIAIAVGAAAMPLALAMPARADTIWGDNHIGNQAGAPTGVGAPFGFTTSLTGQDPAARVVYRTVSGDIEELASSGGSWSAVDLTALTGAPAAASSPSGYTTDLTGQGPAARVVYRTAGGDIEELALPSGGSWQADDLTTASGAPAAASAPFGYTTSLTGQVPAARVVYRAAGRDIEELSTG